MKRSGHKSQKRSWNIIFTMATFRTTAFTSVAKGEQYGAAAEAVAVAEKEVRSNETYGISWTDTYYDKEPDIIAVFDIDYEGLGRTISKAKILTVSMILTYAVAYTICFSLPAFEVEGSWHVLMPVVLFFVCGMLLPIPSIVKRLNFQQENKYGLHVAVTVSGLRRDTRNFPLGSIFKTTTLVSWEAQCSAAVRDNTCAQVISCSTPHRFPLMKSK
jgi:hypothetical protein